MQNYSTIAWEACKKKKEKLQNEIAKIIFAHKKFFAHNLHTFAHIYKKGKCGNKMLKMQKQAKFL